jgi:hypothetical protein
MTGISFDINIGRAVLEGYFYLSLGRLHDIRLNNTHRTHIVSPLQRPISWCCLEK